MDKVQNEEGYRAGIYEKQVQQELYNASPSLSYFPDSILFFSHEVNCVLHNVASCLNMVQYFYKGYFPKEESIFFLCKGGIVVLH